MDDTTTYSWASIRSSKNKLDAERHINNISNNLIIVFTFTLIRREYNFMKIKKIIYNISLIIWFISSLYFLYKYSLNAGYWKDPLLISLFFYMVIMVITKSFSKPIKWMTLFYIGFGVWFIFNFIVALGNAFQ